MNNTQRTLITIGMLLIATASGCSTHTAPGLKGKWKPINHFSETAEAVPINPPYIFSATPADATLKTLLERWAKDSGKTLSYRHPNDYTLYAPVSRIRTHRLDEALTALTAAYANQRVSITLEQQAIVVSESPQLDGNKLP